MTRPVVQVSPVLALELAVVAASLARLARQLEELLPGSPAALEAAKLREACGVLARSLDAARLRDA